MAPLPAKLVLVFRLPFLQHGSGIFLSLETTYQISVDPKGQPEAGYGSGYGKTTAALPVFVVLSEPSSRLDQMSANIRIYLPNNKVGKFKSF